MSDNLCPCCGRHCSLDDPHCERGREYAKTGVIPSKDREDEHGGPHRDRDGHCHGHDGHRHDHRHKH